MTLFPQLSNFLFSPRHRRGLSRFGYLERVFNGVAGRLMPTVPETRVEALRAHDLSGKE